MHTVCVFIVYFSSSHLNGIGTDGAASMIGIEQWFSTGVQRHTSFLPSVPRGFESNNGNIKLKIKLLLTSSCP
jgi:hypothetical protein